MSNASHTLERDQTRDDPQRWDALGMNSDLLRDLNSALKTIGDRNDIQIVPSNKIEGGISSTLDEVAIRSGVPIHRVRLRAGWHRRDHGDLLVLAQASGGLRVLALLHSKNGYEIRDSRSGKTRKLDAKTRKSILPFGWTLVRTFENSQIF